MVLSFRLVVWTPGGAPSSLRRYLDPQEVDDCHGRIAVRTSSPETYPRHETPAIAALLADGPHAACRAFVDCDRAAWPPHGNRNRRHRRAACAAGTPGPGRRRRSTAFAPKRR